MNAKASVKPSPLGRGLSALFGDSDQAYQRPAGAQAAQTSTALRPVVQQIPVTWLQPGAFQPRRHFEEGPLKELADSIRERGVLQPLLVRPIPEDSNAYEIVAGERRWRAAQLAGIHELPVVVRQMTDREAMEIGLIENVQREGLSLLEEADGYRRLLDEFGYTQEALSKTVGKSRSHLTNILRLLTLPEGVKKMLDDGTLTMGHARAVISAPNPMALAAEIVKKGWNVRQAEEALRRETGGRQGKKSVDQKGKSVDADILTLEKMLTQSLGLRVKLNPSGRGGSLTLYYQDLDQLDAIVKRLRA